MFIFLTEVIISLPQCVSNHHVALLKYIQCLFKNKMAQEAESAFSFNLSAQPIVDSVSFSFKMTSCSFKESITIYVLNKLF